MATSKKTSTRRSNPAHKNGSGTENNKAVRDTYNPGHYHQGNQEAVNVIETFFMQDAHLSQAVKYMCRAGRKPESSYVADVGKAAWWLVRALVIHKAVSELSGLLRLMRRTGFPPEDLS